MWVCHSPLSIAESFQTCCFHRGYCLLLPQLSLTCQRLQQGSNCPAERFWSGWISRRDEDLQLWWAADELQNPATAPLSAVGRAALPDVRKNGAWGWQGEQFWIRSEEPCSIREQRVTEKGTWTLGLFTCPSEPLTVLTVRTFSLQYVSNDLWCLRLVWKKQ